MHESIEERENMDNLGQGFTSVDPLKKVDISDGSVPRPTFINKNLKADKSRLQVEVN